MPGAAELVFQFRDTDPAILDALDAALNELLDEARERSVRGHGRLSQHHRAQRHGPRVPGALAEAAQRHAPGLHQPMPSGAGHDAQIISQMLPSAMLFVPSIGGISHHYAENTRDEDIVLGCQVFADAAAAILAKT